MRMLVRGSVAWLGPGTLLDDPAIVCDGTRIVWVGKAREAPEADAELSGPWFLLPGVTDHHVHLGLSDPRRVIRGGVTAVRDLGWPPRDIFPVVDISEGTDFDGPEVSAAGAMLTAPGGYPSRADWAPPGTAREVAGAEEAAAAVTELADGGASVIKVAMNAEVGPTPSDADLVAICEAASSRGLEVTAHVQGSGQAERALGAGVRELAHSPWTERLSGALVEGLARSVRIVSTLDIHSYGRATPELEVAVDNLRRFGSAGGLVRYGTDLGNGPIPAGLHPGEAMHLASAGLSADRVLHVMASGRLRSG
ncbi:MAG TPA: amidohydrolase, partial [Actinomycetota bacterium]|nr:amidohydrolase [Actinomycetota bacterium]